MIPEPLSLSRSEIEATALKAARGAGMGWGLAEEAAFAALWLADQGIDGLSLLARHLDRMAVSGSGGALHIAARVWGGHGPLCPINAGAALGDHFHLPQGPLQQALVLSDLSAPALILPFLAAAAARTGAIVVVGWAGVSVVLSGGDLLAIAGDAALMADRADTVTVTAMPVHGAGVAPCLTVGPGPWQTLQALVQRTYVPASDQSRRGAGAAGSDNA